MAVDKELINLGLNIHQSSKIDKINKSNDKLNKLIKESDEINKKGHKTTQVILAAGFVGLAKQNKEIVGSLDELHDKFAKINNTVQENNILVKKIDNKVDELIDTSKRNEAMLQSQIMQKKISDEIKQIVFEMGQEVKNIKKNSNALERFIMYLIISDSIKVNSNIKIEIIDTIPGKQAFQKIMDSIENGMNDSFEMIPENDLEKIRKLHKAKESLNSLLPEYNNTKSELDIKVKEKEEQEVNFLTKYKQIEEKVLKASEQLKIALELGRIENGENWYKQFILNKKPKAKFLRFGLILSFICFGVPYFMKLPQNKEVAANLLSYFPKNDDIGVLFLIVQLVAVLFLFVGLANWVRNNSFIDKVKNLESITKKGNMDLESITEEESKYSSQIKSAMTLIIEKLNSIISESIINEIEDLEQTIAEKYKNLKNYIDLNSLPSIIFNYKKKLNS